MEVGPTPGWDPGEKRAVLSKYSHLQFQGRLRMGFLGSQLDSCDSGHKDGVLRVTFIGRKEGQGCWADNRRGCLPKRESGQNVCVPLYRLHVY